ncbi:cysteinyl-tRNA synthetase [Chitinophaga niastensis]|uniref:Cysteinyl-tRNA synthetase n=1 Tax=Chitinophaga niastensis TaxID=536980 RepID=A0A2P8HJC4_CHINA|nr:endo alpha-1,4 polygalactosaminidase [Chitinophaga niastensis]PSL46318.1 cysteinyl-tRNA synthetase [Chitinophaga niastensis]
MNTWRCCLPVIAGILIFSSISCQKKMETINEAIKKPGPVNYRQEMRSFIQEISAWARQQKNGFLIVPQNSSELLTISGSSQDSPVSAYIQAIDGMGREELLYGYDNHDDVPTPDDVKNEWLNLCKLGSNNHLKILTTDYCFTPAKITNSYQTNGGYGFISFAATHRQLDNIPVGAPYHENANNINTLSDAQNFLYLINTKQFATNDQYLSALKATNYDVLVIDAFPENSSQPWPSSIIASLKIKKNGGKRLVLAYMSMGQAEQYRWYWKTEWKTNPPAWLEKLDPFWDGNYYVRYWMPEWKALIYGNPDAYTQKLLNAGFDGAYLDPVDCSQYWEEKVK